MKVFGRIGRLVGRLVLPLCCAALPAPGWAGQVDGASPENPSLGQPTVSTVTVPRVTDAPGIEAFLGGQAPADAAELVGFRQRSPGDGAPSSQDTRAYLFYDDDNLYVVFVCTDDPGNVRANMTKREEISLNDRVALYLDTFLDQQRAYVFAANPLGIQEDGLVSEGQDTDFDFDTVWRSEGRLTATGFVVWMAVPFKSLRFEGKPVQRWGLALQREIVHTSEDTYWPYVTDRVDGFVGQFALMEGLEQVSVSRNVQLIPYVTMARARVLDRREPAFVTEEDYRVGVDAKFVLRDAFALDFTANPDFSQVESDDPQVTVNKRFEVFFDEKRPFFLENANYFETPIDLFFSRRIVDPQVGARLTGRAGDWTVGALAADDRAPGILADPGDREYGRQAMNGALRLQRELGGQSNVGVLATSRRFAGGSSDVVSVDTRLRLSPNWFFNGQTAHSFNRDPGSQVSSGPAHAASLTYGGRNLSLATGYEDFSPRFHTDLGAIERVNIRRGTQFIGYTWWPESDRVLSFGPSFTASINYDHANVLQDWYLNGAFDIEFGGQTTLSLSRTEQYEFYVRGFRTESNNVTVSNGSLRWLFLWGSVDFGSEVNYSPAGELQPFVADATTATLVAALRPTRRVLFETTYIYSWLGSRNDPGIPGSPTGASVFNNHLIRAKLNYQFTTALSLRGILDYASLLPNTNLIDESRYKQVRGDLLLTYLINPWTAIHIGYTDRLDNLRLDGAAGVVPTRLPTVSTARQVFVKMSYLLAF